jgi:hypothetical protein
MYIYIDKIKEISFISNSKREISEVSGINYHTLGYYVRKKYYETKSFIFTKGEFLKSKQGSKSKGKQKL